MGQRNAVQVLRKCNEDPVDGAMQSGRPATTQEKGNVSENSVQRISNTRHRPRHFPSGTHHGDHVQILQPHTQNRKNRINYPNNCTNQRNNCAD